MAGIRTSSKVGDPVARAGHAGLLPTETTLLARAFADPAHHRGCSCAGCVAAGTEVFRRPSLPALPGPAAQLARMPADEVRVGARVRLTDAVERYGTRHRAGTEATVLSIVSRASAAQQLPTMIKIRIGGSGVPAFDLTIDPAKLEPAVRASSSAQPAAAVQSAPVQPVRTLVTPAPTVGSRPAPGSAPSPVVPAVLSGRGTAGPTAELDAPEEPEWYRNLVETIAEHIAAKLQASPAAAPDQPSAPGSPLSSGEAEVIVAAFEGLFGSLGIAPRQPLSVPSVNSSLVSFEDATAFSLWNAIEELGQRLPTDTPLPQMEQAYLAAVKAANPGAAPADAEILKEGKGKYKTNPARTSGGVVALNRPWIRELRPGNETIGDAAAGQVYLIMHELVHSHGNKGGGCSICNAVQSAHGDKDIDEGVTDILARAMADATNHARGLDAAVARATDELHHLTFGDRKDKGTRYRKEVDNAASSLKKPDVGWKAIQHYFLDTQLSATDAPRTGRARPPAPLSTAVLDPAVIQRHEQTLGLDPRTNPAKVVLIPDRPGKGKVRMDTPFSTFPATHKHGLTPADEQLSVVTAMGITIPDPKNVGLPFAREYMLENYHGGGYEKRARMVIVCEPDERTLLHELGHLKQDLAGYDEGNSYTMILEYHNVLLHENLDPQGIRRAYGAGAGGRTPNKSWADLLADVRDAGNPAQPNASERMLAEIDATLKTPRYLSLAAEIRNNLIADYFADQSGNRAERQGAAKPPAQNP